MRGMTNRLSDPELINEIINYHNFIYVLINKKHMKVNYTNDLFTIYSNIHEIYIIYKIDNDYKQTSFYFSGNNHNDIYLNALYPYTFENYSLKCKRISKPRIELFKFIYKLHNTLTIKHSKYKFIKYINNNHSYFTEYLNQYDTIHRLIRKLHIKGIYDVSSMIMEYIM